MPPARKKTTDNRLRYVCAWSVPDHVIALAWSPVGSHLAAAAVSGPVHVHDAAGKNLARLTGHKHGTMALAWHPRGDQLATAGQDGHLRIWDTTLWQERVALPGGSGWVEHLAYSPDGKFLASAAGKCVRVWNEAGEQVQEYREHGGVVTALAWKPGQNMLAAAAKGGVHLYQPESAEPVQVLASAAAPLCLAWARNGNTLVHGNHDATAHYWNVTTGEHSLISGFPAKVQHVAFDYTSRWLATTGAAMVCVWDCSGAGPEGRKPLLLDSNGADAPLTALAYQHRGFYLASGGVEGNITVWQPTAKKNHQVGHAKGLTAVTCLALSPDDRLLAGGYASGEVIIHRMS